MEVDVSFVQDNLRGDDTTEIRVKFIKKLEDAIPAGEEWSFFLHISMKQVYTL